MRTAALSITPSAVWVIGSTSVQHNYWGMPTSYVVNSYGSIISNNDISNVERFGWTVGAGIEYAFTIMVGECRISPQRLRHGAIHLDRQPIFGPQHSRQCQFARRRHFRPDLQGARDREQRPPRHQLSHWRAGSAVMADVAPKGPTTPVVVTPRRRTRPSSAASITPIRTNGVLALRPTFPARRRAAALTSRRRPRLPAPIPSPNGRSAAETRSARRSPTRLTAR